MTIYVVLSDYFDTGVFGIYSSLKRARLALEYYFEDSPEITGFRDDGSYTYYFTDDLNKTYTAEIAWDLMDYEFADGTIKEDE